MGNDFKSECTSSKGWEALLVFTGNGQLTIFPCAQPGQSGSSLGISISGKFFRCFHAFFNTSLAVVLIRFAKILGEKPPIFMKFTPGFF